MQTHHNANNGFRVDTNHEMVSTCYANKVPPPLVGMQKTLEWTLSSVIFTADETLTSGLLMSLPAKKSKAYAKAKCITTNTAPTSMALTRIMMWRGSSVDHLPHLFGPTQGSPINRILHGYQRTDQT